MQRVRAGLTGLAAIFLMVLIAAAGLKPARPQVAARQPSETLAVLGVAPGASETDHNSGAAPAPTVAPRAPLVR